MTNIEILDNHIGADIDEFEGEDIYTETEVLKLMDAARKDERKPPFIVAEVREYINQLLNEDITFSRFTELLNTRPKMQKK